MSVIITDQMILSRDSALENWNSEKAKIDEIKNQDLATDYPCPPEINAECGAQIDCGSVTSSLTTLKDAMVKEQQSVASAAQIDYILADLKATATWYDNDIETRQAQISSYKKSKNIHLQNRINHHNEVAEARSSLDKLYAEITGKFNTCMGKQPVEEQASTSSVATATTIAAAKCTYTFKDGDLLSKIASNAGVSTDDLIAVNPQIENPNSIYPGQVINLPCDNTTTDDAGGTDGADTTTDGGTDAAAEDAAKTAKATDSATSSASTGKSLGETMSGVVANVAGASASLTGALASAGGFSPLTLEQILMMQKGSSSDVVGTPYYATGHADVVRMNYYIGLGSISSDYMESILAWTESYELGVSLSEIKWGFYNTSSAGSQESAFIEFTIHDIAGQCLKDFIKIKSGTQLIYFHGPMSDGTFWPGEPVKYKPIADNCSLEFSPTQGFTYKFSGMPIAHLARTQEITSQDKIVINGTTLEGPKHSNFFRDYLQELQDKWNAAIKGDDKSVTAAIQIDVDESKAVNEKMMNTNPSIVVKEKDLELKKKGSPETPLENYEIPPGTTISDAIIGLWKGRFATMEFKDTEVIELTELEVNFKEYKGMNKIDVKMMEVGQTDTVTTKIPVCIGSDETCKYQPFRANLVGINFPGGLWNTLSAATFSKTDGAGSHDGANTPGQGTEDNPQIKGSTDVGADGHQQENQNVTDHSTGLPSGTNPVYDGWATMGQVLNKYKMPDLTLEIELPYCFGFTPMVHGGLLEDSMPGFATGAILYNQGVELLFFWYATPDCSTLVPVPAISTDYRITKVTHTIGLNGNATQVELSHLNI